MWEKPETSAVAGRTAMTSGAVELPMLTKTNYHKWSLVMKVSLEALGLWKAVESEKVERQDDRMALTAVLRGVPSELKATLAVKNTAKEAWEAVKRMRVREDRVKSTNRQRLLKEFENLKWKDGESTDDFAVGVNIIVCGLRELGEEVKDGRVVRKVLRVVPTKWKQVAVSIEMLLDLDTMSMEELVGQLRVAEDADVEDTKGNEVVTEVVQQLYLIKAQWEARGDSRTRSDGAVMVGDAAAATAIGAMATTATTSAARQTTMQAAWPQNQAAEAGVATRGNASSVAAMATSQNSATRRRGRRRCCRRSPMKNRPYCRYRVCHVKLRGVIVTIKLGIEKFSECVRVFWVHARSERAMAVACHGQ
ncbi:hypothetical protein U9M48_039605 [Paspalum notatum var. saurae]|uniref:DUF4219 domain-containing protein n=1 Tax=Paspalum notatum var. saurae TaxID=547442 RepID=A0AAQ3XCV3_PASNO